MIRRLLRWLPALALVAVAAWVAGLVFSPAGDAEGDAELAVLSWNVRALSFEGASASSSLIFSAIQAADPDLVLLQEMTFGKRGGPLLARLATELGLEHQVRFQYGEEDFAGMAILSRHPIVEQRLVPLPPASEGRGVGRARLLVDGRPLDVAVVHLANSDIHLFGKRASLWNELFGENLRTLQTAALLDELRGHREPLLLGGDFNTFPLSSAWRSIRAEFHDAFRVPELFRGTFRVKGDIEVKLDHIFLDPRIQALDARVLDAPGSDHLPVLVRVRF